MLDDSDPTILTNRTIYGVFVCMKRSSAQGRLERFKLITDMLRQDDFITVHGIAGRLGVSMRTITRDIAVLREQGLPIDADRGRGGGLQLDRHWGIGRVNLSYSEAIDLLVSLAVAEQMDSPLFLAQLGSIRRQLLASFPPERRSKVHGLKSRILIGGSASLFVLQSYDKANEKVVRRLHQAFVTTQRLTIEYVSEQGERTTREIEPHYLLLNYPVWYVLAWDKLREAPRTFRCDRISGARSVDEKFKLLPQDAFRSSLEGSVLM